MLGHLWKIGSSVFCPTPRNDEVEVQGVLTENDILQATRDLKGPTVVNGFWMALSFALKFCLKPPDSSPLL